MPTTQTRPIARLAAMTCSVAAFALLAGCAGSSGGPTTAGRSTTSSTTSPSTAASASPSSSTADSSGQGVASSFDPCQLVSRAEASALAGTAFGPGREEKTRGGARLCVYGAQTRNVFTVDVAQAKDAATARAGWAEAQAQAQALVKAQTPPGLHVSLDTTKVAMGDRAATVFGSESVLGRTIGFSGVYVVKGATFFAFTDLLVGPAPPSPARMEGQARTVLQRLS